MFCHIIEKRRYMNTIQLNDTYKQLIDHCEELLIKKGEEYSSDNDRLMNFKQPCSLYGTNQLQTCLFYATKHFCSIIKIAEDINRGVYPSDELLLEKCGDWVNYGILTYANAIELKQSFQG